MTRTQILDNIMEIAECHPYSGTFVMASTGGPAAYGLETDDDLHYEVVYAPSFRDILCNQVPDSSIYDTPAVDNVVFVPLMTFSNYLKNGSLHALELLSSPFIEVNPIFDRWYNTLKDKLDFIYTSNKTQFITSAVYNCYNSNTDLAATLYHDIVYWAVKDSLNWSDIYWSVLREGYKNNAAIQLAQLATRDLEEEAQHTKYDESRIEEMRYFITETAVKALSKLYRADLS